jgi:hypothetical protein
VAAWLYGRGDLGVKAAGLWRMVVDDKIGSRKVETRNPKPETNPNPQKVQCSKQLIRINVLIFCLLIFV